MNKLLVIEGSDASGKTTQAQMLVERDGYVELRLPDYEFETGTLIKQHNKNKKEGIEEVYYQTLQIANYIDLLYKKILPLIEQGKKIVLTRFTPSMKVYSDIFLESTGSKDNAHKRNFVKGQIKLIEELYKAEGVDIQTIFLYMNKEEATRRIIDRDKNTDQKREPVFESDEMIEKVIKKYNYHNNQSGGQACGLNSREEVYNTIKSLI